jgi:hypothetical protein
MLTGPGGAHFGYCNLTIQAALTLQNLLLDMRAICSTGFGEAFQCTWITMGKTTQMNKCSQFLAVFVWLIFLATNGSCGVLVLFGFLRTTGGFFFALFF